MAKVTIYTSPAGEWQVAKSGDFKTESHQLDENNIEELLEYLGIDCEIVEVSDEEIMEM